MALSPGFDWLLRIGGALLYVFGGSLAFPSLVPGLPVPVYIAVGFALLFSSTFLFNRDLLARLRRLSPDEHIALLARQGKIEREVLRSNRALYFDDLDTGCSVYLIECEDGRLLCLNGQDLPGWSANDAEPDEDDERVPPDLPATELEVVWRMPQREVFDLRPRGPVYPPVVLEVDAEGRRSLGAALTDGAFMPFNYDWALRTLMQVGQRA